MTMIDAAYEKTTSRSGKENPLGLFIAVIKERPKSGESAHKAAFKRLVLSDGYEDFVDAIVREWLSIKYSTALRAAQSPTVAEIKAVAARRKGERIAEAEMTKKAIKLIGSRLLDFMMPNGKKLRDCTFGYCAEIGGAIGKIGAQGRPSEIVGNVLTAAQVQDIINS